MSYRGERVKFCFVKKSNGYLTHKSLKNTFPVSLRTDKSQERKAKQDANEVVHSP